MFKVKTRCEKAIGVIGKVTVYEDRYKPNNLHTRIVDFNSLPEILFKNGTTWYVNTESKRNDLDSKVFVFPSKFKELKSTLKQENLESYKLILSGGYSKLVDNKKYIPDFAGYVSLSILEKINDFYQKRI